MSSLPPLPPRRPDRGVARFEDTKQYHLSKIAQGVEGAEDDYKDFLIENGKYFYSLEEVLPAEQVEIFRLDDIVKKDGQQRKDFARAFLRTKAPDYLAEGGRGGVKEFVTTIREMQSEESLASLESEGHSSRAKKKIWCVDILARPLEEAKASEVAHLIPDSPTDADEWYDVACWAIGTDPELADWPTLLRLLHGTKGSNKKRIFGSGMRHFVANKCRIDQQEKLLDKEDPQLLILPIRTREECLNWDGEDYEAIVLVGTNKDGGGQKWATRAVGLTQVDDITVLEANSEELRKSLLLLRQFTFAMVQSLVNYGAPAITEGVAEDEAKVMEIAKKARSKRIESFLTALGTAHVCAPKDDNPGPAASYRGICKIRFSNDKSNNLHPAPDPLLLIARSTVVWSVRNKFRLRASAVAQDDNAAKEWEHDLFQLDRLAKLKHAKQAKDDFAGLEFSVEERCVEGSVDETLSLSSGEGQDMKSLTSNVVTSPVELFKEKFS